MDFLIQHFEPSAVQCATHDFMRESIQTWYTKMLKYWNKTEKTAGVHCCNSLGSYNEVYLLRWLGSWVATQHVEHRKKENYSKVSLKWVKQMATLGDQESFDKDCTLANFTGHHDMQSRGTQTAIRWASEIKEKNAKPMPFSSNPNQAQSHIQRATCPQKLVDGAERSFQSPAQLWLVKIILEGHQRGKNHLHPSFERQFRRPRASSAVGDRYNWEHLLGVRRRHLLHYNFLCRTTRKYHRRK